MKAQRMHHFPNILGSDLILSFLGNSSQICFPICAKPSNIFCAFSLEVNSLVLIGSHLWLQTHSNQNVLIDLLLISDQWVRSNLWKVNFWKMLKFAIFLISMRCDQNAVQFFQGSRDLSETISISENIFFCKSRHWPGFTRAFLGPYNYHTFIPLPNSHYY